MDAEMHALRPHPSGHGPNLGAVALDVLIESVGDVPPTTTIGEHGALATRSEHHPISAPDAAGRLPFSRAGTRPIFV